MATATKTLTIQDKLQLLFELQLIDKRFDDIQRLKGELPMEVADLEDEIEGLQNRLSRINEQIAEFEEEISSRRNKMKEAETLIERYTKQQSNVKNNREFDALTKEIELQKLEVQIAEKRIKEAGEKIDAQKEFLAESAVLAEAKEKDLSGRKVELEKVIKQTEKEEKALNKNRTKHVKQIEDRLLNAYERIRKNYRNGIAVATIERDSCGGCFNKVPPQVQLEIGGIKRIIQCENCARILVPFEKPEAEKD